MNFRSPKLLKDARGRGCLIRVPGICCGRAETSVAAHANWSEYGKGMSIKAHDWATCRACFTCHAWLDQGGAPLAQKKRLWFAGWVRQLADWLRRRVIKTTLDLTNPTPELVADGFARGLITL